MKNLEQRKNNPLAIHDFISIGVFTAIYFVLVTIATFASAAILPGLSNVLLPAICALISGCVYMLMVAKIKKFGGITVMGLVLGLFFFSSGHFILSFAANVVCGFLADYICKATNFSNKKAILLSYIIFSYGLTGPVLPIWFMEDAYVANLIERGKDAAYIDSLFSYFNMTTFAIAMVAILICGIIGGVFGQKMLKKHFVKAGIV